jgi:CheY-like chemotaxis protein
MEQDCCAKILIVDDEYFNIISLKLILEKLRLKAEFAFNGRDALEKVRAKQNHPCS